jgi:hypothetical protein
VYPESRIKFLEKNFLHRMKPLERNPSEIEIKEEGVWRCFVAVLPKRDCSCYERNSL